MKSGCKKALLVIFVVFLAAIIIVVVGFIKIFSPNCEQTNYSISINEYKIEEEICPTWGGSVRTFRLKKNGKKISRSKHNWGACTLGFEIQNDLYIKFDTCNKIVQEGNRSKTKKIDC